jgi:DNA-binding CsgD family transcriptional regulator
MNSQIPHHNTTQHNPPFLLNPPNNLKALGNARAAIRRNLRPLTSSAPGAALSEACADPRDWRHDDACAIRGAWRPEPIFRAGPIQHAPMPDDAHSESPDHFYDDIHEDTAKAVYSFAFSRAVKLDYLRQGFVEDEAQEFTDIIMSKLASGEYQEQGLFDHFLSSQWRIFRFRRWDCEYEPRKKFDPITEVGTGELDVDGEEFRVPRIELENFQTFTKDGWVVPESGQVYYDFDTLELRQRLAQSWDQFTDSEKAVYALTAEGHTQDQVAQRQGVSVKTVARRLQSMQQPSDKSAEREASKLRDALYEREVQAIEREAWNAQYENRIIYSCPDSHSDDHYANTQHDRAAWADLAGFDWGMGCRNERTGAVHQ